MHGPDGDERIEIRVLEAQSAGSTAKRDELLREYEPTVARIASRICKRSIGRQDDEYAIALSGFDEAIRRYSPDQKGSFLSFASMIIRRRLIDYYRREQRHRNQVPLPPPDQGIPGESEFFQRFEEEELALMRRAEVALFTRSLERFGIRMADLVDASPKHRDTRERLKKAAWRIASSEERFARLTEKRVDKQFAREVGLHRNTMMRYTAYLIALAVVIRENLPLMREYLGFPAFREDGWREEGHCGGGGGIPLDCPDVGRCV